MRLYLFWNSLRITLGFLAVTQSAFGFEKFEELRSKTVPSEGILYDRNHEVIHEIRVDRHSRQLEWTPLHLISPQFKEALILSEDHRFWDHPGVDWKALAHVTVKNWISSSPRGASTISMQVVSFLDQKLIPTRKRRSFTQKLKQLQEAIQLEKEWTKEQILEAYLNLVSFRGELKGITAASYGLFKKAPHGLNLNESLILAVLIRAPNAEMTEVEKRACYLGKKMRSDFSCESFHTWIDGEGGKLQTQWIRPRVAYAPHVARKVLKTARAEVTLDGALQAFVLSTLQRQILAVQEQNVHDAAALVVDNASGQVLAYVGGVGELSSASYVDGVRAERQAGSTLKPFLYALTLQKKYLTAASPLDDSPVEIPVSGGVYRPKNYDHEFHGPHVTVRSALASSLNVPAVRALQLIGVSPFVQNLKDLGFENLKSPEYYGPSLALGSADVTLWDLVNAYRVLARGGIWSPLRLTFARDEKEEKGSRTKPQRVYSPEVAFVLSDILSDRDSRSLTFGLENALSLRFWAAVKTGTSKDMRDNWCIGYSDRYTVGVWVGNFSGAPMWNVSGVTGAAPAWAEIMKYLHKKQISRAPRPPQGVVRSQTPLGEDWFLRGTQPESIQIADENPLKEKRRSHVKISYPVDGMVIARDPDIPVSVQKVFFESSEKRPENLWYLNDKKIGSSQSTVAWEPMQAGNYKLSLISEAGQVLDTVYFFVR